MDPVSAAMFMMVTCLPLMFVVVGLFVLLTKLLTKLFPAQ